jgi:alkylation response protein AidB-like acyl-CoA dehydrogenase
LILFGTDEQKEKYLPKLANAEHIGAIAISEPQAGSSFKNMETLWKKRDGKYLISGHKTHINDAAEADVMLVLASTDRRLTAFIVETDGKGINILTKLDPTGYRSSPMYEFALEDVEVAAAQRLGNEGQGLDVFFGIFNFSRIGNASVFIGMSQGALEEAVRYARERVVGHSKVSDFQGMRWLIADLSTKIEAATLLRDKAASLEASGASCARETSMAKYFSGEVAREVTNKAIEICGSYGCYRDKPFDMFYRDAKALLLAGGSSEVMKNIIADLTIAK